MPEICSQLMRTEDGSGVPQTCSCILDSLVEVWSLNLESANFKPQQSLEISSKSLVQTWVLVGPSYIISLSPIPGYLTVQVQVPRYCFLSSVVQGIGQSASSFWLPQPILCSLVSSPHKAGWKTFSNLFHHNYSSFCCLFSTLPFLLQLAYYISFSFVSFCYWLLKGNKCMHPSTPKFYF